MTYGSGAVQKGQSKSGVAQGGDVNGSRATVLIVDNEPAVRALVRLVLADEGYRVLEAADGVAALALIEREVVVDLVLLDLWMPVMDGWQFANAYWGLKLGRSHPPLLVLTAEKGVVAAGHAEGLNAAGFLSKPFDLDELIAAVGRCTPQDPARAELPVAPEAPPASQASQEGPAVVPLASATSALSDPKLLREEAARDRDAAQQRARLERMRRELDQVRARGASLTDARLRHGSC